MRYKKSLIFICLLICLFSMASVCAANTNETIVVNEDYNIDLVEIENQNKEISLEKNNGDVASVEKTIAENLKNDELIDKDSSIGCGSNNLDNLNDGQKTLSSVECDDEISFENDVTMLGASPSYSAYSVSVADYNVDYGFSSTIYIYITKFASTNIKYDFYFKVYDSNNVQKISQRYYSSDKDTMYVKYSLGSTSLSPGVYKMKLINYYDDHVMDTGILTVVSTPSSAYSVSVSDINIDYGSSGSIPIDITPASSYSYYYTSDFYFKVYDSNGIEKISKRYYSTSSSSQETYSLGSNTLTKGVYTIKIFNRYDNDLMSTAKLRIVSPHPPASAYSVDVSDTFMDCNEGGSIKMSITPAYSYTYKHDFYLKVYNPSGSEKLSKRFYSNGFYYTETYNIDPNTFNPGIYTIMIKNSEDDKIMSTAKLTVTKITLETQNVSGNCDEIIEFKVRAAENNNYKSGLSVNVVCNNEEYNILTDNDGYASLKIHLKANVYNVKTIFMNTVRENTIVINPVYIENVYKNVYINSFTGYYNGKNKINYGWEGNLEGYFKIYKGNTLVYQTKFNSNGNIYDYFTYINHANQYSGVEIKKIGTYSSVITDVNGNVLVKATIKIKKASPKFSILKKTFKVNQKTKTIKITLKDNVGVIKNAKLTLKINGKIYYTKTNSKGQATFKITKLTKKGKFTAVVKFAGNKYYNAKTVKPKITVK